jgi:hypothetical protein
MDSEKKKKKYAREFIVLQYFTIYTIGEIIDNIHVSQFTEEEK